MIKYLLKLKTVLKIHGHMILGTTVKFQKVLKPNKEKNVKSYTFFIIIPSTGSSACSYYWKTSL